MNNFWKRVNKTDTCWLWTGAINNGYGQVMYKGKNWLTHRLAYQELIGELPKELDHTCENRSCVNPEHLEPVDHRTNSRRSKLLSHGNTPPDRYAKKKFLLYIRHEQFRNETEKSKLINELLEKHYSKETPLFGTIKNQKPNMDTLKKVTVEKPVKQLKVRTDICKKHGIDKSLCRLMKH